MDAGYKPICLYHNMVYIIQFTLSKIWVYDLS